ncbi:MAG: VCBS repeat-containing protein [Acidobacteriota bacterium]
MNTYEARIKPLAYWFGRQTIILPHWRTIVLPVALVFGLVYQVEKLVISAPREATNQSGVQRARMSDEISVHAAWGDNPRINVSNGHELITPYSGRAELTQILERNEARPLSLCSADFDEDGVPDLISGYAGPSGGIVTLLRGNVDSIYPNAPEAKQRKAEGTFTDAPFLSPAFVFGVPEAADFIAAGDFDGDGHWDVVAARRGSKKLYLVSGDGRGGFRHTKSIGLPGGVTAMVVGDINRRDGLDDVVVGVTGEHGPKVLVFEGPEGALRATPETIDLPAEATSLAFGQLDDGYEMDLAIAAGYELMIMHGRDRRLSLDAKRQAEVEPAQISIRSFPSQIRSIAVADFTGNHTGDIALVLADRSIHSVSREKAEAEAPETDKSLAEWRDNVLTSGVPYEPGRLVSAWMSSAPADTLLIVDSNSRQVQVVAFDIQAGASKAQAESDSRISTSLEVEGAAAVLPMRLSEDELSNLVILKTGHVPVTVMKTQPQAVFAVTNKNDAGAGSLRQAILDANGRTGADAISFNIPGAGTKTIDLQSPLPVVTDPVTIDGTTQPGFTGTPVVALRRTGQGSTLQITAGNSVVRGLDICSSSSGRDVEILTGGGVRIEGNVFSEAGVTIRSGNNVVGGTTSSASNKFAYHPGSANLVVTSQSATNNQIQGNFFLAQAQKCASSPSCGTAISVGAPNNVIGGTTPQARNIIFGGNQFTTDIETFLAPGTLIQGNFIGVDVTGTVASGSLTGVSVTSKNVTIGGTTPQARNVISGHRSSFGEEGGEGVAVFGEDDSDTFNMVQGNYIGTDATGTQALGNLVGIAIIHAKKTTIGGDTPIARNVISGNVIDGVAIIPTIGHGGCFPLQEPDPPPSIDFPILLNYIGTDASGTQRLGNGRNGIRVSLIAFSHEIRGNRIAFNARNGVAIQEFFGSVGLPAFSIKILDNEIFSNGVLGIDLADDGVTANDFRDLDSGANLRQNFPVLSTTSVANKFTTKGKVIAAATFTVNGTFNSTPNHTFNLQFFLGSNCSGSGHQFTGAIPIPLQPVKQVTTNDNGDATYSFSFEFPTAFTSGFVNSTATDVSGNTSEFSSCLAVTNPNPLIITSACKGDGKQLIVNGTGFVDGAKVFLNGEAEKTQFVSSSQVIAFKAGKRAQAGDTLKVRNPDATETPQITYTRNCSSGGTQTEELLTDDATEEVPGGGDGLLLVNRLTPSSYPATLLMIRIYFRQKPGLPSPLGQRIRLVAFLDPSASERPPGFPALLLDQSVVIPQEGGFVDFPVVGPTITAGDLYAGFQAPNPANGVLFSADTNGVQQQRAFLSTDNGLTFVGPAGFGSGSDFRFANFLIRAVVSKGG